jgi:hypothetical protein
MMDVYEGIFVETRHIKVMKYSDVGEILSRVLVTVDGVWVSE